MNGKNYRGVILTVFVTVCCVLSGCVDTETPRNTTASAAATVTTTAATTVTTTTTATTVAVGNEAVRLDPAYQRLLLVNAENPLPEDFDCTKMLVSIPARYCNGTLDKIDKDVYPYLLAMLKAARADGVELSVVSPYRSYATQNMLFNNKVQRVIADGTPEEQAEAVAATAVARPGTSEHQTGLAVDFNAASLIFETLPACGWMMEHAEAYGFILRYPEGKTDTTGVMYEPWHWRFVGINTAKEINRLGVTLEEYVALKNIATE